jgi:hypothetical protein
MVLGLKLLFMGNLVAGDIGNYKDYRSSLTPDSSQYYFLTEICYNTILGISD